MYKKLIAAFIRDRVYNTSCLGERRTIEYILTTMDLSCNVNYSGKSSTFSITETTRQALELHEDTKHIFEPQE